MFLVLFNYIGEKVVTKRKAYFTLGCFSECCFYDFVNKGNGVLKILYFPGGHSNIMKSMILKNEY